MHNEEINHQNQTSAGTGVRMSRYHSWIPYVQRVEQRHGSCKSNQTKLLEREAPGSEVKSSVFIIDAGLDTAGEMISKLEIKPYKLSELKHRETFI